ncbi:MAG TPA: adenylate/guanylate cyclase domain-containing protein [Actinomycetota bacterium]|nr:adenylate/guanylate cyclase domain-containing protein [Actinomycetota bacterium]
MSGREPARRLAGLGGIAGRLAGLGSDPLDDEESAGRKRLLVLVALLILPVATAWGVIYLAFGSAVGILPFLYVTASVGSLVVFSRTHRFEVLLDVQLLDILVMPTLGQMFTGGFLPSGVVGVWAILAPLGALAFLEVSRAIAWFVAFVVVFLVTGILGEVLFADADLPRWFTSMMLALNVVVAGGVAFTLLATFAKQRNAAETAVRVEQQRSELLLLNILPGPIADRLKTDGRMIADHFDAASIVFADVVDFTPLAQGLAPTEVVGVLDRLFTRFDVLVEKHGLEKIKTIGDCYMAASGVPEPNPDHARRAALLALDMREAIATAPVAGGLGLQLRIGINSGPVVAGVIGSKRFLYDLWGDAVNTASRMESHGSPGEIQITRATFDLLKDEFVCTPRGTVDVKGKGAMETWYVIGARESS